MISIVSVTYESDDWANLLLSSIKSTRSEHVETVIVDNGHQQIPFSSYEAKCIKNPERDKTHGAGLNLGIKNATGEFVLILDIDCHFLSRGWEFSFEKALQGFHCLTVKGPPEKPIRPACCFMRTTDAARYDWKATPGYKGHRVTPEGFDVGILAYKEMVANNLPVKYMDITKNRYGSYNGEEYGIDGKFYVYHHWHAAHLRDRQVDYPNVDLVADKEKLFKVVRGYSELHLPV